MRFKTTLILFCAALTFNSYSQIEEIRIFSEQDIIGHNLFDQKPIKAHSISFPQPIHLVHLVDSNGIAAVALRKQTFTGKPKNKGEIVFLDTESRKVLFSRKINYKTTTTSAYCGLYHESSKYETVCVNPISGKEIWKINSDIPIILRNLNIGVGYSWKGKNYRSTELQAYNLDDGSVLWSTDVPHDYGWSDVEVLGDSLLLIAADGLFGININTGQKWHLEARTGYMFWDAPSDVGWIRYTPNFRRMLEYGKNRMARMVASNIIADSTGIFFASADNISKLNFNGEVIWRQDLPENLTGTMFAHLHHKKVVLLNYGYAYKESATPALGIPFFSAFDRNTGEQLYLHQLRTHKSNERMRFLLSKSYLQAMQTTFIRGFDLSTGEQISSRIMPSDEDNILKTFAGRDLYIETNRNQFAQVPLTNDSIVNISSYSIRNQIFNLLTLSASNHEIIEFREYVSFYRSVGKNGNHRLLVDRQSQKSFIVDSNGIGLASFDATLSNFSEYYGKEIAFKGSHFFIIEPESLFMSND